MVENEDAQNIRYDFDCVYLIKSLNPNHQNYCYIGTTPDPQKRLRQHNGEIAAGAERTKTKRPWKFVLIVYGFPNKKAALQFEWAWQHPYLSRHLQNSNYQKNDNTIKTKLRVLQEMLRVNAFGRWSLHLHIVMSLKDLGELVNPSYPVFDIGQFPKHTKVTQGSFEDYQRNYGDKYAFAYVNGIPREQRLAHQLKKHKENIKNKSVCYVCHESLALLDHRTYVTCLALTCKMNAHVHCLANLFTINDCFELLPVSGRCPSCNVMLKWGDLIDTMHLRLNFITVTGHLL